MFVEQLRRAVEASPRVELAKVAGLLWRAYAAGHVTEAEASELSDLIEARRAVPVPPRRPRLRVGSRPRTPESLARRRRWVAGGFAAPGACEPLHGRRDRRLERGGGRGLEASAVHACD